MKRMFLIFSHKLTKEQEEDAKRGFGVEEFVYLPSKLQEIWSNIPPEAPKVEISELEKWLKKSLKKEDIVLVQGDFGATCKLVRFIKNFGAKAVYATTKRNAIEQVIDGKIIKKSIFEHVRFREYE